MKKIIIQIMALLFISLSAASAADIDISYVDGTGYVYLTGNAGAEHSGEEVYILASHSQTGETVYIDVCNVSEDGAYSKKFGTAGYPASELEIKIRCGAEDITHTLYAAESSEFIKINSFYNSGEKKINIFAENLRDKANTVSFFAASYNADGKLLNVGMFDGSYTEDSGVQAFTFDYDSPSETASVKVMAWVKADLVPVSVSHSRKTVDFSEFSSRYTDEEIKKAADDLFSNLTPDNQALKHIYELYNGGDYKTSLLLYRDYMVDVLRSIEYVPESIQQASSFTNRYYYGVADVVVGYTNLDSFNADYESGSNKVYVDYENVLDFTDTEEKSAINWVFTPKTNTSPLITDSLRHLFQVLGIRYTQTGDSIYAEKLLQLMEDFADNYSAQWDSHYGIEGMSFEEKGENILSYGNQIYAYNNVSSNAASYLSVRTQRLNCFIYGLVLACKALPSESEKTYSLNAYNSFYAPAFTDKVTEEGYKIIDPVRLAKAMKLLYSYELPTIAQSVLNHEGGTMNITADAYYNAMKLFGIFKGFKNFDGLDAKLFSASEKLLSDVIAKDGGFIETSFNYNEVTSYGIKNTAYVLSATNSYPSAGAFLAKGADKWENMMVGYTSPIGLIPNIGNVYNNWGSAPYWKDEDKKQAQAEKIVPQSYTSVYYPYSGYGAMRGGWGIDDLYMSFFTNPTRGTGHKFAGTNSVMNVTGFGRTLLVCGGVPWYGKDHASVYTDFVANKYEELNSYFGENSTRKASTVMVNGKSQEDENYTYSASGTVIGKGSVKKSVRTYPLDGKWLAGEYFDFAEGTYDNGYTVFDCESAIAPSVPSEEGIKRDAIHNRQFVYAKQAGAFIVTDVLENKLSDANEYEALWHFPAFEKNSNRLTGYAEEQVIVNQRENKIYTADSEGPNVFLYSLSRKPLEYKKYYGYFEDGKIGAGWSNGGSAAYDSTGRYVPRNEVHVKWKDKGAGDISELITVIVPSATTSEPVKRITDNSNAYTGVSEYVFELENGCRLYISSGTKCHGYTVLGTEIKAKKIIYTEKDGKINGIAVDCERIGAESAAGSFAFAVENGKIVIGEKIEVPAE